MTRILPDQPNLLQLRNQAKDLLKAYRSGELEAVDRVHAQLPSVDSPSFKLATAMLVIAREYGFASWPKLKADIAGLNYAGDAPVVGYAAARRLYDGMIEAIRSANSLSVTIEKTVLADGMGGDEVNRVFLKKPFLARIETYHEDENEEIIVADGGRLWKYWPRGRSDVAGLMTNPPVAMEYMSFDAPTGLHLHDRMAMQAVGAISQLGLDRFHGRLSAVKTFVRRIDVEVLVDGEICDVLDITHSQEAFDLYPTLGDRLPRPIRPFATLGMSTTQEWLARYCVARRDRLPRRISSRMAMVSEGVESQEMWLDVKLNVDLADALFRWEPSTDWTEVSEPPWGYFI